MTNYHAYKDDIRKIAGEKDRTLEELDAIAMDLDGVIRKCDDRCAECYFSYTNNPYGSGCMIYKLKWVDEIYIDDGFERILPLEELYDCGVNI